MTSPSHSDDRADDDDDLIAIVRAGLQDLQPDVTHRVDHHRFWRDGRRRRQRRVALVTGSVVVTLAAVLVPLALVALPGDHDDHLPEVLARPTATAVADRTAPLTTAALVAALQATAPTAVVHAEKVAADGSVVAGGGVVQHINGFVQLGTPGRGLSLEVSAYRLMPVPTDAAVLAYLQNVLVGDLVPTPAGDGIYWLPRTGNDWVAGALTPGGTVAVIVGTLPASSTMGPELHELAQAVAKGLAASSL